MTNLPDPIRIETWDELDAACELLGVTWGDVMNVATELDLFHKLPEED